MNPSPDVTPYQMIGGDASVRKLIDTFYDLMDEVPEYYVIRKLHPADLTDSRDKLYLFLSGWLGGPPLYTDKFGHPMLRARHLPYAIGNAQRDQWMACMVRAMEECEVPELFRLQLTGAFQKTADWMRNKEG